MGGSWFDGLIAKTEVSEGRLQYTEKKLLVTLSSESPKYLTKHKPGGVDLLRVFERG